MEGIYRPSGAGKCAPILVKHHLQPHRHRPLLAPARPLPSPPRLLRRMPRLQSRLPRLQSRLPLDLAAAMVSRSPAPGASATGNSPRRLPQPQRTTPPPATRRRPRFPARLDPRGSAAGRSPSRSRSRTGRRRRPRLPARLVPRGGFGSRLHTRTAAGTAGRRTGRPATPAISEPRRTLRRTGAKDRAGPSSTTASPTTKSSRGWTPTSSTPLSVTMHASPATSVSGVG